MNYAYVRVSTKEQNEARQIKALKKYNIDCWFSEHISGVDMNRPELQKMLKIAKEGDTIFIADYSKLARSTQDLLNLINDFKDRGITLVSDKEQLDTNTSSGKLIVTILAAVYEFEREISKERQTEGIAIAKTQGKYKGGKKKDVDRAKFDEVMSLYHKGKFGKEKAASLLGISRPTLNRIIAEG